MAEEKSFSNLLTAAHDDYWQTYTLVKIDGVWTVEGRPRTTYKLLRIEQPANIPGKSVISILITLPPNAA
jgi:hypothetical protein